MTIKCKGKLTESTDKKNFTKTFFFPPQNENFHQTNSFPCKDLKFLAPPHPISFFHFATGNRKNRREKRRRGTEIEHLGVSENPQTQIIWVLFVFVKKLKMSVEKGEQFFMLSECFQ